MIFLQQMANLVKAKASLLLGCNTSKIPGGDRRRASSVGQEPLVGVEDPSDPVGVTNHNVEKINGESMREFSQKVVRRIGKVKTRGILQQALYFIPRAMAGPRTGVAGQSLGCGAVEGGGTCLGSPCGAVQGLGLPFGAVQAKRTSLGSPCDSVQVEGTWLPPLPTSYCSAAGSR